MASGCSATHESEVVPDSIVDDDRVVQRITEHRKHRAEHSQIELPAKHRKGADGDQHVVQRRNDGAESQLPAEANHDVDEHHREGEDHREDTLLRELFTHLRADGLEPLYLDVGARRTQDTHDLVLHGGGGATLRDRRQAGS